MKVIFLLLACLSITTADVLKGTTSFAKKLYDVLPKEDENLVISPLSVHAVLSLLYQGAGGQTTEIMSKTLNAPDALTTAKEYKDIVTVLNTKGDVTIEVANNVYVRSGYKLKDNFREVATEYFSAGADDIDFSKVPETLDIVNGWVRNKTHNKIDKLLSEDDINSDTRVILLNAIYFKGLWEKQFQRSHTRTQKFYVSETKTVDCEMMNQMNAFQHAFSEELKAGLVKLPFKDTRFSMIIVLPNKINGIDELEKKLIGVDVTSLFDKSVKITISLSVPKFKIESKIELNEPLKSMGLSNIFENSADLSNLIDSVERLKVDKILQKAFIEVNEEGAEASAATGGTLVAFSAPFEFTVDRQFVYYITVEINNETVILFAGRVTSPKYTN